MSAAFQTGYAAYYDLLYKDKDYEAECRFLESCLERFSAGTDTSILDIGSGTGNHAIPLARKGYRVAGADASDAMVAIAREKARREGLDIDFTVMPMEQLELHRQFDAVICMFNVINYAPSVPALQKALANIRRHLKPGGLFVFDFRNGITSLRSTSETRTRWVQNGRHRLLRISDTRLDAVRQLHCTTYRCLVWEGDRLVDEFQDEHTVRFLFPEETRHYLGEAGFEVLRFCRFLDLDATSIEDEWNVMVIARAT